MTASTDYVQASRSPGLVSRARKAPVLTVSIVLFVTIMVILVATSRPDDATPLSIDNPTPDGARAVAQILRAQGVDVRQTAMLSGARITEPESTTLVIAAGEWLTDYQLDSIFAYPGDIVLIAPSAQALGYVDPALSLELAPRGLVTAGCDDPHAVAAEEIVVQDSGVRAAGAGPETTACFTTGAGLSGYTVTHEGDRTITTIAAWSIVMNGHLEERGHAALTLRALGAHPQVVWYVGDLFDSSSLTWSGAETDEGEGISDIAANPDFLPPGTGSALYVLALVVLLTALWRARRFGPLVTEPLPVIVRGSEATRGRARLYRRARASGRATAALRAQAALRMGRRLGVPRAAGRDALVVAVARAAARPVADVDRILYGPPPADDAAMMDAIAALDTLESEVHRP